MVELIKRAMRHTRQTLLLVRRTLRLVWDAAGWWNVAWITALAVQGFIPAALVYMTKWVVDSVAVVVQSGGGAPWEALRVVLVPAGLLGVLFIAQQILGSLQQLIGVHHAERVQDHTKALIHERAATIDYAFYESATYYDQMEQANGQGAGRVGTLLNNMGSLVQSGVSFVTIGAILLAYGWFLPLVLAASAIPGFLIVLHRNKKMHAWWERVTSIRRLTQYYDLVLTVQRSAAELRAYNHWRFFASGYLRLREQLRIGRLRLLRQDAVAQLFGGALALLVTAATMLWILWRAARNQATLGDVALFYQAFSQGQSMMGGLLRNVGQVFSNTLFLEHLFGFLAQENRIKDPPDPLPFPRHLREGVVFDDVTFTYPGSTRPALERFNLHVPAGKIVAVVGENGAGKSTFIKLLSRFYDPDTGRITIDGVDLRALSQQELRRNISVMFQFPVEYQLKAVDNIRMGDLERPFSQQEIDSAAEAAGLHDIIARLPHQYDTQLGRMFEDGAELSGGEWQRVALARAFLRRAPILVLDEPTSSMDSWAELDWMNRFKQLVRGRSALVITHRFTTAMKADIIYVMEHGRVVERGTHSELLALGGRYATSWLAQMEAGRTEPREVLA
ncbi:MAG TPA: ABC transporter ATP-binding protein [Rhodothermales bacterium]|nr:ABC transporter ATP-binding protein [Rhodothermales bacterium]